MRQEYLHRLAATGLSMAFALAFAGCTGSGAPSASSSTQQGTVHGTVKVKGKLAKKGQVSFNPANINRKSAPMVTGEIGEDGTYSVTTLVSDNQVSVRTPEMLKNPKLQYFSKTFNVQSGDNTFDIEVNP